MSSSAESISRRALACAAFGLTLFLLRLGLFPHLAVVAPEECLTGAIALGLLAHDLPLPLPAYVPWPDEPGQLVVGAIATPFVALLGGGALAMAFTGQAFSAVREAVGLALLLRAAESPRRPTSPGLSAALYAALLLSGPPLFTLMSFKALGTHNPGTATDMFLLWSFLRAQEHPSPARRTTFWLCAGLLTSWKIGSLVPVSLGVLWLASQRRPWSWRPIIVATAAYSIGLLPRVAWSVTLHGRDLALLISRLSTLRPLSGFADLPGELWSLLAGGSGLRAALLIFGLCLSLCALRDRSARPVTRVLAAYVCAQVAIIVATPEGVYFCQYLLPVVWIPVSLRLADSILRVARRLPRGASLALEAVLPVLLVLALHPRAAAPATSLQILRTLRTDRTSGVCSWQLGEGLHAFDPASALARCRTLPQRDAMACISGIGFAGGAPPQPGSAAADLRAWSFGVGRRSIHGTDVVLPDRPDRRTAFDAGRGWECGVMSALICRLEGAQPTTVPCPLPAPPLAAFDAPAGMTRCSILGVAAHPACEQIAERCSLAHVAARSTP